jgi:hypothetical protein
MKYDLKNKTDLELRTLIKTKTETSDLHIEATHELERRKDVRTFWRKDIVAWIALLVALGSLVVSIVALNR